MDDALVTEIEEGLYSVNFVPYELGIHTVVVMYREINIPGSPFQVNSLKRSRNEVEIPSEQTFLRFSLPSDHYKMGELT